MDAKLQPGNGLYRRKGPVWHEGTYWKHGWVVHHGPQGLVVEPYEQFAQGQEVHIEDNSVSLLELEARIREALAQSDPYSVFGTNCEHLAGFLQKGIRISPQLRRAGIWALVGFGVGKLFDLDHRSSALLGATAGYLASQTVISGLPVLNESVPVSTDVN